MISIVCVYNDEQALKKNLLKSLENQTAPFELITIDNLEGRFESAAKALNYGGRKAKGQYIMFIHQDVALGSNFWLEKVESILSSVPDMGIAGCAGKDESDRSLGFMWSSHCFWGRPFVEPQKVQTLDECVLIIPKEVFQKIQFDEQTFDGWHCYGADYCLSVKEIGLNAFVIPAFIYHKSPELNIRNLLELQKKLLNKHRRNYKHIYTTCWNISSLSLKKPVRMLYQIRENLISPLYKYLKKELLLCTILDLTYLEEGQKKGILPEQMLADIRELEFKGKSYDAVLAWDVLGHLAKEEGYQLIRKMEGWARKKVIIFSPHPHLAWNAAYKSAWKESELKEMGFDTYKMKGWRVLGEGNFCWMILRKLVYHLPGRVSQSLAIKRLTI